MVATLPTVAEVTDPSTATTGPGRAFGDNARWMAHMMMRTRVRMIRVGKSGTTIALTTGSAHPPHSGPAGGSAKAGSASGVGPK